MERRSHYRSFGIAFCCVSALVAAQGPAATPPLRELSSEQLKTMVEALVSSGQGEQLLRLLRTNGNETGRVAEEDAAAHNGNAVIVRAGETRLSIAPTARTTRFVPSQANTFAEIIKTELISAAIRTGIDVARDEAVKAITKTGVRTLSSSLPYSVGYSLGRIGDQMKIPLFGRKTHKGFEFDYVTGVRAAIEFTGGGPLEFAIPAALLPGQIQPALLRVRTLDKDQIRVLGSRKVELKEEKPSGAEQTAASRTIKGTEKEDVRLDVRRSADGTVSARTTGAISPGEYVLAFVTSVDSFELNEVVFPFRIVQ
jgi:hypothetical protein